MSVRNGTAVLGLGIENLALARYLLARGSSVTVCDSRDAQALGERYDELERLGAGFRLGPGYLDGLEDFAIVYRSPGLPLFDPLVKAAAKAGVKVTSAMRAFVEMCPCATVGVTGTKGKGTTSSLIHRILSVSQAKTGDRAFLGGNIGIAPFEFLPELDHSDVVVLELSSFQLEDMDHSVDIAVITNITEDHLASADPLNPNHHATRADYVAAKTNIYRHQDDTGVTILNMDDSTSRELSQSVPGERLTYGSAPQDMGAWFIRRPDGGYSIRWNVRGNEETLIESECIQVRGEHNLLNIAAAALASYSAGADCRSIVEGIAGYTGLEHRLEYVATVDGVGFFDDSFATAPDPTIVALRAFREPIILIAGGADKGADFSALAEEIISQHVKAVVLAGVTGQAIGEAIKEAARRSGHRTPDLVPGGSDMASIVNAAVCRAEPGDVVLLSTACASFGMFKNYKVRGDLFKEEVRRLAGEG